ncbi:thimet oligopeptidase [Methanomicrobium sp. W14]|uniref:M3 family metallopeptidase n=1 Tax=Methanomicrobium sp. W14 TaxID=2817839 RepID=UPI001AE34D44|nr:thimet oligopeptidase [Methanomicrobium sp. W14]
MNGTTSFAAASGINNITFDPGVKMNYSSGEIPVLAKEAQDSANASLNTIANIPPEYRTFENTVIAFDSVMTDYSDAMSPMTLVGDIFPDPEVLAEGLGAKDSYNSFLNDVYTREDLYNAMKGQTAGNPVEQRLYDVVMEEFDKNGLGLSGDKTAVIRDMKTNLSSLETKYNYNINSDDSVVEFTKEELAGISQSDLNKFDRTADKNYSVKLNYPNYAIVMKYADDENARKRAYIAYSNIEADKNTKLIEEAISLRTRIAEEMGYSTWAEYVLSDRMAKNVSNVMDFLNSIKEPLSEKNDEEMKKLLEVKKSIDSNATTVFPWDKVYLSNILKENEYSYDEEKLKSYFPYGSVLNGVFDTCGKLFGVNFIKVENASVWSPDVSLYEVTNSSDGKVLGYLYVDPYVRDGKYTGAAAEMVITGREKNGEYVKPVAVIIGNFEKPQNGRPSLLSVSDIETLFHETGHSLHIILSKSPYGTLSGYNVDFDFTETPSQTLEEWAWDPEILELMSGKYDKPSEKIPDSLLKSVISARDFGKGISYSSQLMYSLVDMYYHNSTVPVNTTNVWNSTYEEVFGEGLPVLIHPQATFPHLMGGYDAGYYGYLWSKVYALDIDEKFKEYGMTNETLGLKLRDDIYSKGNTEDNMVLLENFLGEKPGVDALYDYLGLNTPDET